jgi:hypothetical protein
MLLVRFIGNKKAEHKDLKNVQFIQKRSTLEATDKEGTILLKRLGPLTGAAAGHVTGRAPKG